MPTSLRVIFAALLAASVVTVNAQTFPSKPVRIIIPFPPGAGPDIVARTAGVALTGRWAQQVLVDNRPGGGGNIATEIAAKAAPDGYTLLLASNHVTINPSLFKAVPYDPVRSFAPVIHLDMTAVLAMPDIRHALMLQGLETVASTSEDFVAYIQNDIAKWARVVRDAHVRVD